MVVVGAEGYLVSLDAMPQHTPYLTDSKGAASLFNSF